MKRYLILQVVALLLVPGATTGEKRERHPAGVKHVVVIGIDGLSVDGLARAVTPHLDRLMAGGATSLSARVVLPSYSAPNWASMLAGAGPEAHGVTSNEWRVDRRDLEPVASGPRGFFPTVLDVIRARHPGACLAMIYHWEGIGHLFDKEVVSINARFPSDGETVQAVARVIREEKPLFLFAQLDEVDAAGHASGHGTPAYLEAVRRADSLVGLVTRATREAGIERETLLVIVSDHGGTGRGHGGNSPEEVTVPFILHGAGVKRGYAIPVPVYVHDLAPTVTFALGLEDPPAWRGKAARCAFEGFDPPGDPLSSPRR
jgi:predicted AlkP superfamily pyrophosphatase or phosphodiesterase